MWRTYGWVQLALILVLGLLLGPPRSVPAEEGRGALKPGSDLPGPFHPFNVTGERKGFYQCQICRIAFDPGVMIVKRGVSANAALRTLLTGLDKQIQENPRARLNGFVVFLTDEKTTPILDEEKRAALTQTLEDLAKELNLRHVVVTLAAPKELTKYDIPQNGDLTVLLFRRYLIEASEVWPEQVEEAQVQVFLKTVAEKALKK